MFYLELSFNKEDYLTSSELKFGKCCTNIIYYLKKRLGVIVKNKKQDKCVYIIPEVNDKFLNQIKKYKKINGDNQICISDELFYKDIFMKKIKENDFYVITGNWIKKYMIINVLKYIIEIQNVRLENIEIAFLVIEDYELVVEYIKRLASKVKIITIVTPNIKQFSKIEEMFFKEEGITLNIVNNAKKSLLKINYVINIDYPEKLLKKYCFENNVLFINFVNYFKLNGNNFNGLNINGLQIAMPQNYLKYLDLFKKFNNLNVYESFIKKNTCVKNIIEQIENDEIKILWLEDDNKIIKETEFFRKIDKILDK